jgi:hypothetical protein
MQVSWHAGYAAGQNLAALGYKFAKKIGIFVIQSFDRNIDAAPGHGSIGTAEIGSAFSGFGFHNLLFYFAMKGVAAEEWVILFLFQAAWGIRAFLIASRDVARDGFTLGFGLGAF